MNPLVGSLINIREKAGGKAEVVNRRKNPSDDPRIARPIVGVLEFTPSLYFRPGKGLVGYISQTYDEKSKCPTDEERSMMNVYPFLT